MDNNIWRYFDCVVRSRRVRGDSVGRLCGGAEDTGVRGGGGGQQEGHTGRAGAGATYHRHHLPGLCQRGESLTFNCSE